MNQIHNHWLELIGQREKDKVMKLFSLDLEDFIESFGPNVELTKKIYHIICEFVKGYGNEPKMKKLIREWKVVSTGYYSDKSALVMIKFVTKSGLIKDDFSKCFYPILNQTK